MVVLIKVVLCYLTSHPQTRGKPALILIKIYNFYRARVNEESTSTFSTDCTSSTLTTQSQPIDAQSETLSTDSEVTFANTDDHDTDSTSNFSYYPLTPNVATPDETSSEIEQYTPSHTPSGK